METHELLAKPLAELRQIAEKLAAAASWR